MREEYVTQDELDGVGEGIDFALRGDIIRKRHIATRASNRREILVYTVGDAEFEGYSIGLDGHSLQLLELASGDVHSIALEHIVAISDGELFNKLSREDKDTVDRRTASFRKTSQSWLESNWPKVYDHREESNRPHPGRQRFVRRPAGPVLPPPVTDYGLNLKDD